MATIEERLKDAPFRLVILAACAFARTVEYMLADERSLRAIETAERFADGQATDEEVRAAEEAARAAWFAAGTARTSWHAERAVRAIWATGGPATGAAEAARAAATTKDAEALNQAILDCLLAPRLQSSFPGHVAGLAATIYEKRDWTLLPILADALEEIGQEEMAAHCRQPIHAKGCHVLDSILADRFLCPVR